MYIYIYTIPACIKNAELPIITVKQKLQLKTLKKATQNR